jgi:hypothetical protein
MFISLPVIFAVSFYIGRIYIGIRDFNSVTNVGFILIFIGAVLSIMTPLLLSIIRMPSNKKVITHKVMISSILSGAGFFAICYIDPLEQLHKFMAG